ncbi:Uncharacterised protein [Brevundimonas diminuta]|uniref:Uncharacterized protein n=1 Tax=Brevundimonas diminuta TaxID=293 RepID=A0A2X1AP75_BREDI|nr:Uncharacterised protein [Brevundimonas diminuta]
MFRWRVTSDLAPRSKKGQPDQSTTGVASANWIQAEVWPLMLIISPVRWPPISRANTGTDSASPIQNRRVKSVSSGFGALAAVTSSGSSAMPQIGQEPGPTWRISGCMGQV